MLIKRADDQASYLAELEQLANGNGPQAKSADRELKIRRAGIRGEAQAAYLIDFDFGASTNWAVIHDLRLEHAGRVAQIDHLLINRFLDIFVLETKSFCGVKITEEGEFLRWNDFHKKYEGMASPLEQNNRHIQVLKDVTNTLPLPERLGVRLVPSFHSYVLVEASARIDRPRCFDSSRVIKADHLKRTLERNMDKEGALFTLVKAAKLVASDTLQTLAQQLAALHMPLRNASSAVLSSPPPLPTSVPASGEPKPPRQPPARIEPYLAPAYPTGKQPSAAPPRVAEQAPTPAAEAPVCKHCQGTAGSILYGKYGYYLRCGGCGKNTAMRPTCLPGHSPRLRKERDAFHRECAECGTSTVIFHNPPEQETP